MAARNDIRGIMSFFSGLNDEKYDRQYTDRVLTGRIIGYFKPQKKRLGLVSVLAVLLAIDTGILTDT